MTQFVVDASVVAKWFFPEDHSLLAQALLSSRNELIAPELLLSELSNICVQKVRRGQAPVVRASRPLRAAGMVTKLHPVASLIESSTALALERGISAYDALYVALALREQCPLVTADRRLYNTLQAALPETMLWIENMPEPA